MENLKLYYPVKPINFKAIQRFGIENTLPSMIAEYNKIGLKGHNGWDINAYHGQPVYSTHKGIITWAGLDGSNGYIVVLKTLEAFTYKNGQAFYKTLYGHLIKEIPVKVGQVVDVGEVIGYADNTGFSYGDHLHFGVKPIQQGEEDWQWFNIETSNGYYGAIDPEPFFNGLYAQDYKLIPAVIETVNTGIEIVKEVSKDNTQESKNQSIKILDFLANLLKSLFS